MIDFTPLGALIEEARQKHSVRADQPPAERVEQIDPPAYCVDCDALRGTCGCGARFYHESWLDLQTVPQSGKILPQYEDWFHRNDFGHKQEGQVQEARKPRSLDSIRTELVPWVFMNERLSSKLEAAYSLNPHQVSLLSADLRKGLEAGRIENPSGALYNELGKIREA